MIEAIRGKIELSARQGTSQARIALAPAELGDIRIHLTQSSQGLIARVTAGTAAAAQALTQGRGELQQSLSTLGLSLLSLDIGLAGQSTHGERQMNAGPTDSRRSSEGSAEGEEGAAALSGAGAIGSGRARKG